MSGNFPVVTEQDILESARLMQAHISVVTRCECGIENYGARIGCECGGKIEWLYQTYDGRYLKEGIDVCAIAVSQ